MEKKRMPVYVTDEELRRIRHAAGSVGLSVTEYSRRAVLAAAEIDIKNTLAAEAKRGER